MKAGGGGSQNFSGILPHVVRQDFYAVLVHQNCAAWLQAAQQRQDAQEDPQAAVPNQTGTGLWQNKRHKSLMNKTLKHHLAKRLLLTDAWQQTLEDMQQRLQMARCREFTKVRRSTPKQTKKVKIAGFHPGYKAARCNGIEPTLAGLRGGRQWQRQRLFAAIDLLRADDLRVMKRGFPSRWLVSLLTARRKPDILQTASFERSLPFRCRGGHHQPFLKS